MKNITKLIEEVRFAELQKIKIVSGSASNKLNNEAVATPKLAH